MAFRQLLRLDVKPLRQALASRDIEKGEAFQERHGLRLATFLRYPVDFGLGYEPVRVAGGDAMLTFPNMAPQIKGLPEGQPELRRKTLLDDRPPED